MFRGTIFTLFWSVQDFYFPLEENNSRDWLSFKRFKHLLLFIDLFLASWIIVMAHDGTYSK
jgi:hypothetical protein